MSNLIEVAEKEKTRNLAWPAPEGPPILFKDSNQSGNYQAKSQSQIYNKKGPLRLSVPGGAVQEVCFVCL